MKKTDKILAVVLALVIVMTGVTIATYRKIVIINESPWRENEQDAGNKWASYTPAENIESGMLWPEEQAFPTFATPADVLDTIENGELTADEKIAFSALQGLVNKTQPRIYLMEGTSRDKWAESDTVGFLNRNAYNGDNKYDLIKKYAGEVDGVVLYSTQNSDHYRNLATTVAGLRNAVPVTSEMYEELQAHGIALPVVEDLTELSYTDVTDIYEYLYREYWPECTRRLIVSLNPADILTFTRDIAAATGSAVVYLDCKTAKQRKLYEKFLEDMANTDCTSVATGWFTEERSGIGAGTKYGIGTVPSDFYMSSTVYGGTDHTVQVPSVPLKDALENKVYVAVYISDGDNIQYDQGYMRDLWDESESVRGQVALNWTISPSLTDLGPSLLNYYYTEATDKDCFVCGPSGLGYALPINTIGGFTRQFLSDKDTGYINNYTRLSGTYFERAGLRVVTAWDNLSDIHRSAYEANCRYLYGATVHDWSANSIFTHVKEGPVNDLYFEKHTLCYTSSYSALYKSISKEIEKWDKNSPKFLSYQVSVWGDDGLGEDNMKPAPAGILKLYQQLSEEYPEQFEFVRADHYFALLNEANNLNYNLSMNASTIVTASDSGDTASLRDGSSYTMWTSSGQSGQFVQFDLGEDHSISRYVLRLAGDNGMSKEYNISAFHVEMSADGESWTTVDAQAENTENVADIDLTDAVSARYVRFVIDDAAGDGFARIADIEVYGR